jgi:hypothetical protein
MEMERSEMAHEVFGVTRILEDALSNIDSTVRFPEMSVMTSGEREQYFELRTKLSESVVQMNHFCLDLTWTVKKESPKEPTDDIGI